MERSFDVMDSAASNSGAAGAMMGAGLGIGAGVGVGSQVAQQLNVAPTTATPPPLTGSNYQYYVAVNGQQTGPMDYNAVVSLIQNNSINAETLIWRAGMANWDKIKNLPEFASSFSCPPPLPPTM